MKAKRAVALAVVVMLVIAVVAMPVAASYDKKACPNCGRSSNIGIMDHASTWSTYGNNSCSHGTGGTDLYQRGTCTIRCFYDNTDFSTTERSVLCVSGGKRYY